TQAFAQLERNRLAGVCDLPGSSQFWLQLLRQAIQPHEYSTRQVANGFRGIVGHEHRIKRLGLGVNTKTQLAAGLSHYLQAQQDRRKQCQETRSHAVNSSFVITRWKLLTTAIRSNSGTNIQGCPEMVGKLSSSRSKLPQDGRGSETPSPRIPRLA